MPGLKTTEERITAFIFEGKKRSVTHGKEVIKFLVDELAKRDANRFALLVADLGNRRKAWIKDRDDGMLRPYLIRGTKWYIDTNMSTANIKKKAKQIVKHLAPGCHVDFESYHLSK